jgi:hypothetical protein
VPCKVPEAAYAIGADIAAGTGATNSCLSIVNSVKGEKVGEYANPHIQAHDLAPLAVALCWLFKDSNGDGAKMAWEMQGPGLAFGKRVIELNYRNIYYRTNEQKLAPRMDAQLTPGWYPAPEPSGLCSRNTGRPCTRVPTSTGRLRRSKNACFSSTTRPAGWCTAANRAATIRRARERTMLTG